MLLLPAGLILAWDWLRFMDSGFWIDECGAYWLTRHLPRLTHGPYTLTNLTLVYSAISSLFTWAEPPWMEAVARLPSTLSALGCGALLYRLSERTNGRGTGWIAMVLYALLFSTINFATQFRPYAMAQCVFVASLWSLHYWTVHRRGKMLALHLACLVLLAYTHFFFIPAWALCWVFVMLTEPDLRWHYTRWLSMAACLLFPIAYVLTHLSEPVGLVNYLPAPDWLVFLRDLFQHRVGITVTAVVTGATLIGSRKVKLPRGSSRFVLAWILIWLAWPLALFTLGHLTGKTFYAPRYMAISSVGFALFIAGLLGALRPWMRQVVVCVAFLAYLVPGNVHRQVRGGDMRRLAAWVQMEGGGAGSPWIAPSLFIEGSLPTADTPEEQLSSSNFSNLTVYPVLNPVFPAPYAFASFSRPLIEHQLDGAWRNEKRIIAGPAVTPPHWLIEVFVQRGYRPTQAGEMLIFERSLH
jgi:hypothetical protein